MREGRRRGGAHEGPEGGNSALGGGLAGVRACGSPAEQSMLVLVAGSMMRPPGCALQKSPRHESKSRVLPAMQGRCGVREGRYEPSASPFVFARPESARQENESTARCLEA